MKKVSVNKAGGRFELKEEPIPEPSSGYVRVKVQACGICHSDAMTKEGSWPGIVYPRAPGHEIAGVIDALGLATDPWRIGDRVGVGWYGGHCGKCESCRRGDFITCAKLQVPGIDYDGGYSEYYRCRWTHWPVFRTGRPRKKPRRSCAQASLLSMHCATAAPGPAT